MKTYKRKVLDKEFFIAEHEGEKGPVILIHGLTGNHQNMQHYANKLKGEYQVLSVDLLGRGDSDPVDEGTNLMKHGEYMTALVEEIGSQETILIGHSMGAYIASLVASKSDYVKKLILLDGGAQIRKRHDDLIKPALSRISRQYETRELYIDEVRKIYDSLGISWNTVIQDSVVHELGQRESIWKNKSEEGKILKDWESASSFKPSEVFSSIACPILLVYAKGEIGPLGTLFSISEYEDVFKNAKDLKMITSESNHYTMIFEYREEIMDAIDAFI